MDDLPNAEMRCLQVSKGGMKYELIVSCVKSRKKVFPSIRTKAHSLIDIQRRQDQAEVRRLYQRNTRIPSQHLNHIAEVRENRRKSICDFRSSGKKESDQKFWNLEKNKQNRMKSMQVKSKSELVRPQTAPVQDSTRIEAKCFEEHLSVQTQLLEELSLQADNLLQAVKNLVQSNSSS